MTDLPALVRELRAEVRQTARALAELGVPPEAIVDDARTGIGDAIRDHARSGR